MTRSLPALSICLLLAGPVDAQSPCQEVEQRGSEETLLQLAERCGVSLDRLLDANNANDLDDLRTRGELVIPQERSDADWLDRARQSVVEAGERIGDGATAAGRSASDYLRDQPDLNEDIVRFGEQLGLPGFETGSARGAQLDVRGEEGSRLTVQARGLPGDQEVRLGWLDESVFKPVDVLRTSRSGEINSSLEWPEGLPAGEAVTFVLQTEDGRLRLAADPVTPD
ncbi:hypothetical protein FE840_017830 (plasmid) [Peteryoungia desertarenae]|uniref:LysM domain-containing protein n=1 Tax=Peteryoungia desertarenae TaxID=1813451 RepID=A0ABX6QST6_9HYPH|nr:hypothetical protein [Peteryoungia desertarenae]QLF71533.1 hypothetical protein FE840_017830 [Peteryoungia desertarenae]